jgi:hypothetical protein
VPLTGLRASAGGRANRPASVVLSLVAAWLLAGHGLAGTVAADGLTRGQVLVPADHVDPGASFRVSGYDLDEDAPVRIELVRGEVRVELAGTSTAADGTLDVGLLMPESFPTGYAELHVIATGVTWTTTVLVGDRAEGPGVAGRINGDADWLLWAIAVAGAALIVLLVLRSLCGGVRVAP